MNVKNLTLNLTKASDSISTGCIPVVLNTLQVAFNNMAGSITQLALHELDGRVFAKELAYFPNALSPTVGCTVAPWRVFCWPFEMCTHFIRPQRRWILQFSSMLGPVRVQFNYGQVNWARCGPHEDT